MGKNNISTSLDDHAPTSLGDQGSETDVQLREDMQPYFDANPGVDKFYVTSDGMPFYELNFAENQQRTIDKSKEVVTINR